MVEIMFELLVIMTFTQLFRILDGFITRTGYQRPYYAVHAIHNVGIMTLTVFDVHRSFCHMYTATEYPINWWAIYLCVALHAYHIIDYFPSLRFDDWLHHGLMIGVAIPLGLTAPAGALFGANLFFTTGLPGLISYSLLFAERNCWLAKPYVQKMNALTNLWIRAPGCVAQATLTMATLASAPTVTTLQQVAGFIVALLTAWNGLYFMEQALSSATGLSSSNSVAVINAPLASGINPSSSNSVAVINAPLTHRERGEQEHGNTGDPSPSHSARTEPPLALV